MTKMTDLERLSLAVTLLGVSLIVNTLLDVLRSLS